MSKNIKKIALALGWLFCLAIPTILQGMDPIDVKPTDVPNLGSFATALPVTFRGLESRICDGDAFYTALVQPYFDILVTSEIFNSDLYKQVHKVKFKTLECANGKEFLLHAFFYTFLQAIVQNAPLKSFFSDSAHCAACIAKMKSTVNKAEAYKNLFTGDIEKKFLKNMSEKCYVGVGEKMRKKITWLFGSKPSSASVGDADQIALDKLMEEFFKRKFKEKTWSWSSCARSALWSAVGIEGLLLLMVTADQLDTELVYAHYVQWLKHLACIGVCSAVVETPKMLWRWITQ